jgi:DNA-directed RNA polymerase subunit RPC12/RpoP
MIKKNTTKNTTDNYSTELTDNFTFQDHLKNKILYECGSCKFINKLDNNDSIMCKSCGYRILYKVRTNRYCEYLCR